MLRTLTCWFWDLKKDYLFLVKGWVLEWWKSKSWVCHTIRTSDSMKFNKVSDSHLPTLMQTSCFDTHYKAYAFPVFKGRDQPLWRMKMKRSFWKGLSFHIFLSSNVIRQVPDYTIKGHDKNDFDMKRYTIFLGEDRLAAEVIYNTNLHTMHIRWLEWRPYAAQWDYMILKDWFIMCGVLLGLLFHVLQLGSITCLQQNLCRIGKATSKHLPKSDETSVLPLFSYGSQKCIVVDSLIEYIGPPNCVHYWGCHS